MTKVHHSDAQNNKGITGLLMLFNSSFVQYFLLHEFKPYAW